MRSRSGLFAAAFRIRWCNQRATGVWIPAFAGMTGKPPKLERYDCLQQGLLGSVVKFTCHSGFRRNPEPAEPIPDFFPACTDTLK